ncbi:MAG TPA: hypothetical protein VJ804_01190 [Acidimicrobiales bacterium]|nr:hypothetical protein [Acidimicrobiales bacterium]
MSEITPFGWRAAKLALCTVGGGVALTFAMAGTASADDITVQDAPVVNAGVGVANSGGNTATGNTSQNVAGCGQAAVGVVANNSCTASNESNGTAEVQTGDATGVGNQSATEVQQAVSGGGDPGLDVTVQDSDVTNAGLGVGNSGGNAALGNGSQNLAGCGQLAVGLVASNSCDASNSSDGSASIETGDATGIGNQSATKVQQTADHGDGSPGPDVVWQDADVTNVGIGLANSGGNAAAGNLSSNLAVNLQGAFGVFASNTGSAKNTSNGSSSIKTGNATGIGNSSVTEIEQGAAPDGNGPAFVFQSAPVVNAGIGIANSGLNADLGNGSLNAAIVAQVSFGLLASNVSDVDNWSDGFTMVVTGDATGIGNQSATTVKQYA